MLMTGFWGRHELVDWPCPIELLPGGVGEYGVFVISSSTLLLGCY